MAAISKAKFVTTEMVRPSAVVIDARINRTEHGLVGNLDFKAVRQVASQITLVLGGVGLLTITMLLHNTSPPKKMQTGGC